MTTQFGKLQEFRSGVEDLSAYLERVELFFAVNEIPAEKKSWTKAKVLGAKPPAREYHSACCIAGPLTGQDHPVLMVTGGCSASGRTLGDVWLLDVDRAEWREVTPSKATTLGRGCSATVFGSGPNFRVVVLFGGGLSGRFLSDTTLYLFELIGGSWQVTGVVRPSELGQLDRRTQELMKKLEILPQKKAEAGAGSAEAHSAKETLPQVLTVDLSDLEFGRELGRGGFGVVFEGIWKKKNGKKVAIKKSSEDLTKEIIAWGSLPQHPNIISLFGVASDKYDDTYLVIELAKNGSLHNFLYDKKISPKVDQSLAWALDVARAMKFLHDHDIIHRDLKSANILFSDTWEAKLCDFGIARKLTQTTTTAKAGTYRWMAPEVIRSGKGRINKKCDLFSYGMILYELFAHKLPYEDTEDPIEISIRTCNPADHPPVPPSLPSFLHDVLKRCWEIDASKRPTFEEIMARIESNHA